MKARIKFGTPLENNLTLGKWYTIKRIGNPITKHLGRNFEIDDDNGSNCFCLEFKSHWIKNGSWEIVDED